MASALAAKMGFNSLMRKKPRNFSVRICTMESDMEFSCEVCISVLSHQFSLNLHVKFDTSIVNLTTTPRRPKIFP